MNSSAYSKINPLRPNSTARPQSAKPQIKRSYDSNKQNINVINIQLPKQLKDSRVDNKEFSSPKLKLNDTNLSKRLKSKDSPSQSSSKRKPLQSLMNFNVSQFSIKKNKIKIHLKGPERKNIQTSDMSQNEQIPLKSKSKGCQRHPQKKPKYQVEINKMRQYFCSKCAINLAAQGFKISQIRDNEINKNKSNDHCSEILKHIKQCLSNLDLQISTIHQIYRQQQQKLLEYYKTLTNTIQSMKAENESSLRLSCNKIVQELQHVEREMKDMAERVETINLDILENQQFMQSKHPKQLLELQKAQNQYILELMSIQERVKMMGQLKPPTLLCDKNLQTKLERIQNILELRLNIEPKIEQYQIYNSALKSRQSEMTFGNHSPQHEI